MFRHQTYADLAIEYGKTKRWAYTQIHSYELPKKSHKPRAVTLVCDTTFYGKRKDKLATVTFYDTIEDELLLWRHVDSEKSKYYKENVIWHVIRQMDESTFLPPSLSNFTHF